MKIIDYLKTNVNELLNSEKITFSLGGKSFTYTVRELTAGHELGVLHYGNAQKGERRGRVYDWRLRF